jgi:membrane-associated phospholipid phosphatase
MSSPYISGQWRPTALILANLLGLILFASWLLEPTRSLWMELDEWAFWGMNNSLAEGRAWQWLWAISNNRLFDLVPATGMLLLFYHRGVIKDRENLNRYIAIGILMLITIVIASQIGKALPIKRPSATFAFPEALRISELVPGVFAKDTASDSFPGDHGLVLLLFAGFVSYFMPRVYGIIAGVMMVLFTMPRLMGGSHWLTDEIVGALAIGMMCLSWVLATPLHAIALDKIEGWVERRRAKPSRT